MLTASGPLTKMNYDSLLTAINSSSVSRDKKDYLIKMLDGFKASKLTEEAKLKKYKMVNDALLAYVDEKEAHKLSTIISGTIKGTAKDIVKPFTGIWDSVNFLTKPPVLIFLALLAASVFIYIKFLKGKSNG